MEALQISSVHILKSVGKAKAFPLRKRVLGGLLDLMILLSPTYLYLMGSALLLNHMIPYPVYKCLLGVVYYGYGGMLLVVYPLLCAFHPCGSFGKQVMGLQVVGKNTKTISWKKRWLRVFVGLSAPLTLAGCIAGGKGVVLTIGVLALFYIWTPLHKSWVDLFLSTKVIDIKKGEELSL